MKKITVAIIGNIFPEKMNFSLNSTISAIEKDFETVSICFPQENITIENYNELCIKHLYHNVKTEFVLIVQYDGMGVRKDLWTDDYFNYDYIGAPWPERFYWITEEQRAGGNGGFSLRSMKLLETLQSDEFQRPEGYPEDLYICGLERKNLIQNFGIKFSPYELANQFSVEWCNQTGNTLGFHGLWNSPLFFNQKTVIDLIHDLPKSYWYTDRVDSFISLCNQKRYFDAKMTMLNTLRNL